MFQALVLWSNSMILKPSLHSIGLAVKALGMHLFTDNHMLSLLKHFCICLLTAQIQYHSSIIITKTCHITKALADMKKRFHLSSYCKFFTPQEFYSRLDQELSNHSTCSWSSIWGIHVYSCLHVLEKLVPSVQCLFSICAHLLKVLLLNL